MASLSINAGSTAEIPAENGTPASSPGYLWNPMGVAEETPSTKSSTVSRYWHFICPGELDHPPKIGGSIKYLAYHFDVAVGFLCVMQNLSSAVVAQKKVVPGSLNWTKIDSAEFHRKLASYRKKTTFGEDGVLRRKGLTPELADSYRVAAQEGRLHDIPPKMYKYRKTYYDMLAEENGKSTSPVLPESSHPENPHNTINGDSATINSYNINNYNYYAGGDNSKNC